LSNSYFACLFFCSCTVSTYGFWAFSRCLKVSLSYDVAELIKSRVSLANKYARLSSRNPMDITQSCGKKPSPAAKHVPHRGQTHKRALRAGEICPVVQACNECNDIFLSAYLSIYPSIHRIGGGCRGSMRAKKAWKSGLAKHDKIRPVPS
jgi:hypothetical protein